MSNFTIAIAGNPNVGKSTLFNRLTGLHQHTGNWPGKTVVNARGTCDSECNHYTMVDLPGTYSLTARSSEEVTARDFLCFGEPDAAVVVCDGGCLERNLNLVLQVRAIVPRVLVCINLLDEAARKGIQINLKALSWRLKTPVIGIVARHKESRREILEALDDRMERPPTPLFHLPAPPKAEVGLQRLETAIESTMPGSATRWLALQLLEGDDVGSVPSEIMTLALQEQNRLESIGVMPDDVKDAAVSALVKKAAEIAKETITQAPCAAKERDVKIDRVLTGKKAGIPVMLALLAVTFWLTITGANVPSQLLGKLLFYIEEQLAIFFVAIHAPAWVTGLLVHGAYRVLAWVVSVMLPPMAIFFPLFTLLEDVGYLPRVAFNLDRPFARCRACGKQALTMCMGFGCNAAGVVGCRIIDSPRERLIAILTNSFVPCNGRFPLLIAMIALFYAGSGLTGSITSALLLTAMILLGVGMTFFASYILSRTVLRGVPSSFVLELPPYRKPQIGKVLVRSVLDRTLFVLGRAAAVAAPAGAIIWILANVSVDGVNILTICSQWLDPFAHLLGIDGVILLAFVLGFPANEIVLPLMIMMYLSDGCMADVESITAAGQVLAAHSWTVETALCTMLLCLFHWPCSTTLLTIRKESGSIKWAVLAAILPTIAGVVLCALTHGVWSLFFS